MGIQLKKIFSKNKKKKIGIIVEARSNSSRLPNKHFLFFHRGELETPEGHEPSEARFVAANCTWRKLKSHSEEKQIDYKTAHDTSFKTAQNTS